MHGMQEVSGSIPLSSTKIETLASAGVFAFLASNARICSEFAISSRLRTPYALPPGEEKNYYQVSIRKGSRMLSPSCQGFGKTVRHFMLALVLFLVLIPISRAMSPQTMVDGQLVYLTWLPLGASLAMMLLFGRVAAGPMLIALGLFYHFNLGLELFHTIVLGACLSLPLLVMCAVLRWRLGRRWRYQLLHKDMGLRIICLGFIAPLVSKFLMVMVGHFVDYPSSVERYFGHGSQLFLIVDAQNMVASMMIFGYLFYYPLRLLLSLPRPAKRWFNRVVVPGERLYVVSWLALLVITLVVLCYPVRTLLISGYLVPLLFVLFTQGAQRFPPRLLLFLWSVSAWFLLNYNGNFLLGSQTGMAVSFVLSVIISFTVCLLYMVQIFRRSERVKRRYFSQSLTDPLTQLPNLRGLGEHLRQQQRGTLCCLRLSNLDFLSRHYGIMMRIHCAKSVAAIVETHLQQGERLFQLPGCEVLIFLKGPDTAGRLSHLVDLLSSHKVQWNQTALELEYGASWAAVYQPEKSELERLLGQLSYLAEEACASRQILGLDNQCDQITGQLSERVLLLHVIKEALEQESIELYVQPIEDNRGGGYYEILSRIKHGDGLLTPDKFIPLIAEFNLSQRFDMLILRKVLHNLREHPVDGNRPRFSVNLMPSTLMKRGVALEILALFNQYQVPVSSVIIEITEAQAFSDAETSITNIAILNDSGFRIAIDDFGTGYANFERLKNIRADIIKIDGCFIRDVVSDRQDYMIVKSICDIASVRGLGVVAEFVETAHQRETLLKTGVGFMQGYLIGRPRPLHLVNWHNGYSALRAPA
ncbi:hypothetical protein TUM12370_10410 [Salmonella enterica subsp. enterica serovar Choleraesuis]|nr:hypothetical protein TUM12370_10410 [Salmonella enterica subsp. enterica serovar Choleraesuis]